MLTKSDLLNLHVGHVWPLAWSHCVRRPHISSWQDKALVYRCTISCFDVRPRPSVLNAMADSLAAVNRSSPTSLAFLKSDKKSFRTGGWCQTVFVFSDCILRWCAHLQKLRTERHTVCMSLSQLGHKDFFINTFVFRVCKSVHHYIFK